MACRGMKWLLQACFLYLSTGKIIRFMGVACFCGLFSAILKNGKRVCQTGSGGPFSDFHHFWQGWERFSAKLR